MNTQSKIDLSISLISFNNKKLLEDCLNSIFLNIKKLNFEVLLVDNNSKDGSPLIVKEKFPQVKIICNRENRLFIKAHNQNLKKVKGRYFLVLNEDTVIPPLATEKMVKFMDKNPKIGLASCRQIDEYGNVDMTCSRFPTPIFELFEFSFLAKIFKKIFLHSSVDKALNSYHYKGWGRDTIKKVDVIPGSFFMGRQELLKKVGLFDEKLLFFYVEPDYCIRVKKANFSVYHNGKISIMHLKAKSLAKLSSFRRYQISEYSLLQYYKKYFGNIWWLILWLSLRPNWLYWRFKDAR